ncbi:hypothetical protein KFL_000280110 [Klebsormidium nitens]|uniref:Golgi apparatus membrane protein TVP15 n=1 Tax=Klebsormidium nitens TaxID=105231 RepID=A0A1Y1HRV7_KLENI|nr:hypothetical protein KFL_000280110 [Klebsormidium nitens]|eukprot:GAQ79306.1 hypothetical protein KFL_000280110 [Klebsormidium nitens]
MAKREAPAEAPPEIVASTSRDVEAAGPAPLPDDAIRLPESLPGWKYDGILYFSRLLSFVTATAAVICAVIHGLAAYRSFKYHGDVFLGILRIYAVLISVWTALAETEWEFVFRSFSVLQYWIARGVLQIFVAVLTKALGHTVFSSDYEVLLHIVASWILLGCGIVYILAGAMCIGSLKRTRMQKALRREEAIRDLRESHGVRERLLA